LIDLAGANADTLAQMLRDGWGAGSRQVQIKIWSAVTIGKTSSASATI
jgi:hypothetical protein